MEELKSLVTRAQSGDLDAYGEMVRRFQDMAYGYAYSILGDFHHAEDAAQEAFIEAYRDLAALRAPAAFPGWLRRIVFKHCDRLTRHRRASPAPLATAREVVSREPGPVQAAEAREMKDAVLAAIRALPDNERTATTLFYINGYTQQEIADFLEVPVTTVNNRLYASRRRLKKRIVAMVGEELRKGRPSEDFGQRVVTLAAITRTGLGQGFVFEYAKGIRIRTRVDEAIQARGESGPLLLLICGPTDVTYFSGKDERRLHLDSYVLVPGTIVSVTAEGATRASLTADTERPRSYEIVAVDEPNPHEEVPFAPSPVATGAFDLAPDGLFGFVRLGGKQRPYEFRSPDGTVGTYTAAPDDVYVPCYWIERCRLKQGDQITCTWRKRMGNERYASAVDVLAVNRVPFVAGSSNALP